MPQHRHQTFDQHGKLLHEVIEEYEEPRPSPKTVAREKLRQSNSVAALRTALLEYIDADDDP